METTSKIIEVLFFAAALCLAATWGHTIISFIRWKRRELRGRKDFRTYLSEILEDENTNIT